MKKAILQIFTAILVLGLFCGAAAAAPTANFDVYPSTQNSASKVSVWCNHTVQSLNATCNLSLWTLEMELQ